MDFMDEARRIAWEAEVKAYQRELKKEEFKRRVAEVGNLVINAAPTFLALTPTAVVVTRTFTNLVGTVGRAVNQRDERKRREHTCYDRSEGHYWNLKRKLTNADWVRINQRKGSGERLGDILREMKLLK